MTLIPAELRAWTACALAQNVAPTVRNAVAEMHAAYLEDGVALAVAARNDAPFVRWLKTNLAPLLEQDA